MKTNSFGSIECPRKSKQRLFQRANTDPNVMLVCCQQLPDRFKCISASKPKTSLTEQVMSLEHESPGRACLFLLNQFISTLMGGLYNPTGKVPDEAMFCLLCIRRDAQAVYMMHVSALTNSEAQTGRPSFVVPPFQNLADGESMR